MPALGHSCSRLGNDYQLDHRKLLLAEDCGDRGDLEISDKGARNANDTPDQMGPLHLHPNFHRTHRAAVFH